MWLNRSDGELLSSWKKGHILLAKLIERHGRDVVNNYRRKSNTPKEIQKLLENKKFNEKSI